MSVDAILMRGTVTDLENWIADPDRDHADFTYLEKFPNEPHTTVIYINERYLSELAHASRDIPSVLDEALILGYDVRKHWGYISPEQVKDTLAKLKQLTEANLLAHFEVYPEGTVGWVGVKYQDEAELVASQKQYLSYIIAFYELAAQADEAIIIEYG